MVGFAQTETVNGAAQDFMPSPLEDTQEMSQSLPNPATHEPHQAKPKPAPITPRIDVDVEPAAASAWRNRRSAPPAPRKAPRKEKPARRKKPAKKPAKKPKKAARSIVDGDAILDAFDQEATTEAMKISKDRLHKSPEPKFRPDAKRRFQETFNTRKPVPKRRSRTEPTQDARRLMAAIPERDMSGTDDGRGQVFEPKVTIPKRRRTRRDDVPSDWHRSARRSAPKRQSKKAKQQSKKAKKTAKHARQLARQVSKGRQVITLADVPTDTSAENDLDSDWATVRPPMPSGKKATELADSRIGSLHLGIDGHGNGAWDNMDGFEDGMADSGETKDDIERAKEAADSEALTQVLQHAKQKGEKKIAAVNWYNVLN